MRYSISNAIPHNPKSEKHPYENLVKSRLFGVFSFLRRNRLITQGRYTDAVDDILCKVMSVKKQKIRYI